MVLLCSSFTVGVGIYQVWPLSPSSICDFNRQNFEVQDKTWGAALITSGLQLCFLPMMWFCWLCQHVTSTVLLLQFSAKCEMVRMRLNTSKSETSVLCQERWIVPYGMEGNYFSVWKRETDGAVLLFACQMQLSPIYSNPALNNVEKIEKN